MKTMRVIWLIGIVMLVGARAGGQVAYGGTGYRGISSKPGNDYWNAVAAKEALERAPAMDERRFIGGQWTLCYLDGWVRFSGRVYRALPNAVIIDGMFKGSGQDFSGRFMVDRFPHAMVDGERFEYSAEKSWWAKPAGVVMYSDEKFQGTIHKLDYGALSAPVAAAPVVTPEQRKAAADAASKKKADNEAKALAWNLKQAAAGDAFGEYRMGQRYRDGDGVAKDLPKAREWLAKAAAHGQPGASNELAALLKN